MFHRVRLPLPPECGTKYHKTRIKGLEQKAFQSIGWVQLRFWGARNRISIPLECVHVAVVKMVAFYLAATVRQTRKHAYVFFGRSFKMGSNKI